MNDNEKYMIKVVGTQTVDGEKDKIEVITEGSLTCEDDRIVIVYPEYNNAADPSKRSDTTVTLTDGILTIQRDGEMSSDLVLEKGVRHECLYRTPMGQLFIGIFTDNLKADISEHGGIIEASYQLDFNSAAVSYNEIYISVQEK